MRLVIPTGKRRAYVYTAGAWLKFDVAKARISLTVSSPAGLIYNEHFSREGVRDYDIREALIAMHVYANAGCTSEDIESAVNDIYNLRH